MSTESKAIGQVAHDAAYAIDGAPADFVSMPAWEEAASAAVMSWKHDIRPFVDAAKRMGAAEERERLAMMFEEDAGANRQTGLTRMVTYKLDNLIAMIRVGGKP